MGELPGGDVRRNQRSGFDCPLTALSDGKTWSNSWSDPLDDCPVPGERRGRTVDLAEDTKELPPCCDEVEMDGELGTNEDGDSPSVVLRLKVLRFKSGLLAPSGK